MRKSVAAVAASLALWAPAAFAHAGVYTDDLTRCLVKATTPADQTDLIVWVFSAISVHPAIKSFSVLTEDQRVAYDKKMAALMTRLLTVDCKTETATAVKYEGAEAISTAFGAVGEAAFRGLSSDPKVAESMGSFAKYLDEKAFADVVKDAKK